MVKVLEHCRVYPAPGGVDEMSIPLTFLDLLRLPAGSTNKLLLFFELPISTDLFTKYAVPSIKNSFSLALKHTLPLAGNLIYPPNFEMPQIRYVKGDSMPLVFAESEDDFDHLTGNHARNASVFHSFVPELPPVSMVSDEPVIPITAIQVTLFPNSGICIGLKNIHAVCDGNTFFSCLKLWASIFQSGETAFSSSGSNLLPFYDKTPLKDPRWTELEATFWNQAKQKKCAGPAKSLSANNVIATFVMPQNSIEELKKQVTAQYPTLSHVTAFTVTCGHVWSCMVKANVSRKEEMYKEDEEDHFGFWADLRRRLSPPLPENYFGNCTMTCIANAKRSELEKEDGFVFAAKGIGEAFEKKVNDIGRSWEDSKSWMDDMDFALGRKPEITVGVAASPSFHLKYEGGAIGRLKKIEHISIDGTIYFSLGSSLDKEGDLEIGLSLPILKMEAFAHFYKERIKLNE
ncbi:hypothetical protein K2173_007969 [Erythroxylum novogranatense]|uniref:Uncharacterized protein n=1 Tax=Erythroxylum novogranatense TaxID=1862640 RepID=A0AAV8T8D8_9ROSI|nr:hypothetical protein K2173_007969 [Erythroxylum novogranatense]